MNDSNREHFEAFPKEAFEIFINCLETQGYVIDCKEVNGYSFSSTQLDNMTEEVFNALIIKFNIKTVINYVEDVSETGSYHPEHGGYSIMFNKKIINYENVKKVLEKYLDSLS